MEKEALWTKLYVRMSLCQSADSSCYIDIATQH